MFLLKAQRFVLLLTSFWMFLGWGAFPLFSQNSEALNKNVRELRENFNRIAIFDPLEKKRLYAAVTKGLSIEFQIDSKNTFPSSVGIGVATDSSIQEWEISVYDRVPTDDDAVLIRKERIKDLSILFEIQNPPPKLFIEIRLIQSKGEVSLVELLHGYQYGYRMNADKNYQKAIKNPQSPVPNTNSNTVVPNDTYNHFEIFKTNTKK